MKTSIFSFILILLFVTCKKDKKEPNDVNNKSCILFSQTQNDSITYYYFFDNSERPVKFVSKNHKTNDSSVITYSYNGNIVTSSNNDITVLNANGLSDSSTFTVRVVGTSITGKGYRKNYYNTKNQLVKVMSQFIIGSTIFNINSELYWNNDLLVQRIERTSSNLMPETERNTFYNYNTKITDKTQYWLNKSNFTGFASKYAISDLNSIENGGANQIREKFEYKVNDNNLIIAKTRLNMVSGDTLDKFSYGWKCN